MRHSAHAALAFLLLAASALSQTETSRGNRAPAQIAAPPTASHGSEENGAIELLKTAEAEAGALDDGAMRAWVLWQIGIGYQRTDRAKALELFDTAFTAARTARDDRSAAKSRPDPLSRLTGHPTLSPILHLQADIARSIVLLEPKRADQVLQQIDPAARNAVLVSVLASQEKEQQFDQALETLNRITAQDEMPYEGAMRLMDSLKPEQSGELMRLFLAALSSYRDHSPHAQVRDTFPVMLSRYWKRLPKEVVRQAIDEVLKQAADADQKGSYAMSSEKGTVAVGSLYEYRLLQLMPVLREFDPAAAKKYVEKYPALASAPSATPPAPAPGGASFRPGGSYRSAMTSMAEMSSAQKVAAKVDGGHADEAMSEAANLVDVNLRAQAYEYIARVTSKKQDSVAGKAIDKMLQAAQKLQPREAFPYYGSAAGIYMQLDLVDAAKKSIETGLAVADKLFQADSDDDDPNTALKAFWPSTNAYCALLRQAARISHTWAISLLKDIKDPAIKIATETALAGGWLNAPLGPSTIMTSKKNSNSFSVRPND